MKLTGTKLRSIMSVKHGFPYLLYYDPEFEFDQPHVDYKPESQNPERTERVQWIVDQITKTLKEGEPIRNPVLVYIRKSVENVWKLHPGKCRVRASRAMGWTTVPAIIVDKTNTYDGPGKLISVKEAEALYVDDAQIIATPEVFNQRRKGWHFKGEEIHPSLEVRGPDGIIKAATAPRFRG